MNTQEIHTFFCSLKCSFSIRVICIFVGEIIGYALKKVLKILAIVVGMFFAGLVYIQYQQIVSVNWDKVQTKSQGAVAALADVTTQISNNIGNATGASHPTHAIKTSLGIC